jgi:uncharacterized protein YuzE
MKVKYFGDTDTLYMILLVNPVQKGSMVEEAV